MLDTMAISRHRKRWRLECRPCIPLVLPRGCPEDHARRLHDLWWPVAREALDLGLPGVVDAARDELRTWCPDLERFRELLAAVRRNVRGAHAERAPLGLPTRTHKSSA